MEAEDFPRGRESENETNTIDQGKRRKRTRKKTRSRPVASENFLPRTLDVDDLRFRSPGVKLMGMVTEVTETHLRVSLPHAVEETVEALEASDVLNVLLSEDGDGTDDRFLRELHGKPPPLTELFAPGQFVHGTYIENTNSDCQFSLRLQHFYRGTILSKLPEGSLVAGCVRTIEDHGFTISFGTKGISGFLTKTELESSYGEGSSLHPGQLLNGVIKSSGTRGVIQLTVDPDCVRNSVMVDTAMSACQCIVPGMLIHAEITQITDGGILLSVMKHYKGIISLFHLPKVTTKQEEVADGWQSDFIEGQIVRSRVLAWDPDRSVYLLSLKPFLVGLELPRMPAIIGQVFTDAVIQRADPIGLSLKLPTRPVPTHAFVFLHSLGDLPLQSTDFKLKQLVSLRVTGFHAMEGLVIGSLKESVIRSGIVCFDDLYPGRVSEGSLVRICDDHVYVSMGEGIQGLSRQCGFSVNISLRQIFNPGQLVAYRVLKLKPETHQAILSLDAQLVHASLPFLTSWDDIEIGLRVIGYVLAVKSKVVIVAFAGDIHGVMAEENTRLGPGETLTDCFQKNQIIKPWIKNYIHRRKRLILTTIKPQKSTRTKALATQSHPYSDVCKAPDFLAIGELAEASVEKVLPREMGFLVAYTTLESQVRGKAILPLSQLADHPFVQQELVGSLTQGASIGHVVVLKTSVPVEVSKKPSLISNASMLPRHLEDMKENMLLHGYISFVGADFVNVSFLGDLSGRVFKNQMPLSALSPHKQFQMGQSVLARVLKVDEERRRINLTLNPSRTSTSDAMLLEDALEDIARIRGGVFPYQGRGHRIGEILEVVTESVEKEEIRCTVPGKKNLIGIIPKAHLGEESLEAETTGQTIKACLLDVSTEGHLILSAKPYLIEKGFKTVKKGKRKRKDRPTVEKNLNAVVEWIAAYYLVVTLPDRDHMIAKVLASDYNLQCFPIVKAFQLGQQISIEETRGKDTGSTGPIYRTQLVPLLWHRAVRRAIADALTPSEGVPSLGAAPLQVGDAVHGVIEQVKEGGVTVTLTGDAAPHTRAFVQFIDLFDRFTDQLPSFLRPGISVQGVVKKLTEKDMTLSLRESDGGKIDAEVSLTEIKCPTQLSRESVELGTVLHGYVSGYGKNSSCLFVNISSDMYATVFPPHFGDDALLDLPSHFPVGKLVKGTVISSRYPRVGLSLRSGRKPLDSAGALRRGTVANVTPQGIYVALEETGLQGLVPRYDLKPHQIKAHRKGQHITTRVSPLTDAFHLMLDLTDDEIAHKDDHDAEEMEVEEESVEEAMMEPDSISDATFEEALAAAVAAERDLERKRPRSLTEPKASRPKLSAHQKHAIWGDIDLEPKVEESTEMTSERQEPSQIKHECVKDREEEPRTDADFERLLFSCPNSSYLWIRYMAMCLDSGNIAGARATAERALETISFREEKERLDVWLAYLNLERTQDGTTESVMSLFRRAILCNDPKKLHLAFLKILETSRQTEIGDLVLKSMHRRCPSSAKVYIQEMHYWLSTQRGGNCKRTLEMALQNLPKRKHVKVIVQAGILEFKIGKVERGRDIFEGLLSLYPKRMDIWNVYLDQELAQDDKEHVRALFERASSVDGGRRRMKWIFKRFLQFEVQHGTEKTVSCVKEKARAYVAKKNDELV